MKQTGHLDVRGAVRRAVHPGHGDARELSLRARRRTAPGCIPRRWIKQPDGTAMHRTTGEPVVVGRVEAMSKSKRNTVDPRRSSPATAPTPRAGSSCRTTRPSATWSGPRPAWPAHSASPSGCSGWWKGCRWSPLRNADSVGDAARALRRVTHRTIAAVSEALDSFAFNVAVARLYELANAIADAERADDAAGLGMGAARGGGDAGPADRADDAAPGGGGVRAAASRIDRVWSPNCRGRRPIRICWWRRA